MKIVRENINFERGQDPIKAMDIGKNSVAALALKKEKLINKIMRTVFKGDDPKYYDSNVRFLESLTYEQLIEKYEYWK
jgi:hypothetical protein